MRNIMKNRNNLLALVALVCVFPGAAHAFSQEKDGIKIQVKAFMNDPYAQVINNPNWTITAEDLQKNNIAPISVKVTNNTDKPICISGRSIKLLQASPEDVAAKFKKREILPSFLLLCVNGVAATGYWAKMFVGEGCEAVQKIDDMHLSDDDSANIAKSDHPRHKEWNDIMTGSMTNILTRTAKIIRISTLTGFTGALAFWAYLKDCNNQLNIVLKQSILDEQITIAPGKSVEKVIMCEGMLSQSFNFNVFNRSHVPVTEFAVDLGA